MKYRQCVPLSSVSAKGSGVAGGCTVGRSRVFVDQSTHLFLPRVVHTEHRRGWRRPADVRSSRGGTAAVDVLADHRRRWPVAATEFGDGACGCLSITVGRLSVRVDGHRGQAGPDRAGVGHHHVMQAVIAPSERLRPQVALWSTKPPRRSGISPSPRTSSGRMPCRPIPTFSNLPMPADRAGRS